MEFGDLALMDGDTMNDDDRIGQAGAVKVAVDFGREHGFAVQDFGREDVERHLGFEDFAIAPCLDRCSATEFSAYVVDNRSIVKQRIERPSIMGVDRVDVRFDYSRKMRFHSNTSCKDRGAIRRRLTLRTLVFFVK